MSIETVLLMLFGIFAIVSGVFQAIDPERFIVPKGENRWWASTWRIDSPLYMRLVGVMLILIGSLAILSTVLR